MRKHLRISLALLLAVLMLSSSVVILFTVSAADDNIADTDRGGFSSDTVHICHFLFKLQRFGTDPGR